MDVCKKTGQRWSYHASHSDQGLMYYLAKYIRQDVTIAIGNELWQYNQSGMIKPALEAKDKGVLAKYQPKLLAHQFSCDEYKASVALADNKYQWKCTPPYNSFAHFYGKEKPWQVRFNMDNIYKNETVTSGSFGARIHWFRELNEMNNELQMGIDLQNWQVKHVQQMQESPLGYMAMWKYQLNIIDNFKE